MRKFEFFCRIKIFFCIALILAVFFQLNSCSHQNEISELFMAWYSVEKALPINDMSLDELPEYSDFIRTYENFRQSNFYRNTYLQSTFHQTYRQLDFAIKEKNPEIIVIAISNLEIQDKHSTELSNSLYFKLAILLMGICLIASVLLIYFIRQYEKKRNEAKQLGIYSNFMIKGIEWERKRISKDIHDTVLQEIKALSLKIELIDGKSKQNNVIENENLRKNLLDNTKACMNHLRSICSNLTPMEFKNQKDELGGFIIAVKNLSGQFMERSKINCILKIHDSLNLGGLNQQQILNVFRIIQEVLNNIEKHSKASRVSVIITNTKTSSDKESLKIFITDDGIGFDVHKKMKENSINGNHFGISNIKDRAKELEAKLQIISGENEGTEIILEVPLE